jgi:hypothetical protein
MKLDYSLNYKHCRMEVFEDKVLGELPHVGENAEGEWRK